MGCVISYMCRFGWSLENPYVLDKAGGKVCTIEWLLSVGWQLTLVANPLLFVVVFWGFLCCFTFLLFHR